MGDKAGRWLRVSTSGQSEENQEPDVDKHIADQGYEPLRTYRLHGKSASKGEQETALAEAIEDIRNGEITVLVAWTLDRLDRRGIAESFGTKLRIEQAGGRVEFAREPSMSELEFAVKAYMAGEESERRSERALIGLGTARGNGAAVNRAPWGLRVTGPKHHKRFEPTAQGRKFAPEAFGRIADGQSLTEVALWLKANGVGSGNARTVGMMIRDPSYKGTVTAKSDLHDNAGAIVFRKGAIIHRCEPLVDAALWKRANDALDSDTRRKRGPNQVKALLSGIARCAECGAPLYRAHAERGAASAAYRCKAGQGHPMVPVKMLDKWVDGQMAANGAFVLRETLIPGRDYSAEIEAAEDELRRLPLQGLEEDAEDARRAELRAERRRLRSLPAEPPRTETEVMPVLVGDLWSELDQDEKRRYLLASEVTVYAAGRDPSGWRIEGDPSALGTGGQLWEMVKDRITAGRGSDQA